MAKKDPSTLLFVAVWASLALLLVACDAVKNLQPAVPAAPLGESPVQNATALNASGTHTGPTDAETAARSASLATLFVSAYPNPSVLYLNNVSQGETPLTVGNLTPGVYLVRLQREGYWPHSTYINISAGEAKNASFVLKRFKNN